MWSCRRAAAPEPVLTHIQVCLQGISLALTPGALVGSSPGPSLPFPFLFSQHSAVGVTEPGTCVYLGAQIKRENDLIRTKH